MANISIFDLRPAETEFAELSDMEVEKVMGGAQKYYEDVNKDGHKDRITVRRRSVKVTWGNGRWDDKA